jgi:CheY-like chemotaxis protein
MNPATRVLIIEDEPIVAMLAEDMLDSIGCVVAGLAASASEARAAIDARGFDVAMLDINLDGEDGLAIADILKARGIPFVITSGYAAQGLVQHHPEAPVLAKPYAIAALEAAIQCCVG